MFVFSCKKVFPEYVNLEDLETRQFAFYDHLLSISQRLRNKPNYSKICVKSYTYAIMKTQAKACGYGFVATDLRLRICGYGLAATLFL